MASSLPKPRASNSSKTLSDDEPDIHRLYSEMHLTAPLGDQNQLQSRPCKCTSPSNPGLPSTPLSETALTTSNTTHRNNKLRPLSTNTQHHKIHVSNRPPSLNHALQSGRKATEQQAFSPETFETNTTRRKRRRSRGNSFPPPLQIGRAHV